MCLWLPDALCIKSSPNSWFVLPIRTVLICFLKYTQYMLFHFVGEYILQRRMLSTSILLFLFFCCSETSHVAENPKPHWQTLLTKFQGQYFFLINFFYFWLCCWAVFSGRGWGLLSNCSVWASQCSRSSCFSAQALEHGLSRCGSQA